jgi:hypothetical protein
LQTSMWLSNSKKYATDGIWKSVHEVGSWPNCPKLA